MELRKNGLSLFNPLDPYNKDIETDSTRIQYTNLAITSKVDWNDDDSVNHIKNLINDLLSKTSSEGIKEEDMYLMFGSNRFEMVESLRFGQLSVVCHIDIDRFGRRTYHYLPNTVNTMDYNDKDLYLETKHIITALNKDELNRLKSKLNDDIKQNNNQYDHKLYVYLNGVITDFEDNKQNQIKSETEEKEKKKMKARKEEKEEKEENEENEEKEEKEDKKRKEEKKEEKEEKEEKEKDEKEITYKLQEIIQRKDEEIQRMIDINDKQKELINNLREDNDNNVNAGDIDQCLKILNKIIIHLTKSFELQYNENKMDEIANINIDNLINSNSEFNVELNKYLEAIQRIDAGSAKLNKSINDIKQYIDNKYIPNIINYKEWTLNDIILWIKTLENGRYIKYLNILLFGFKESEILNGEILPDLNTSDLAVTPFNIKNFKDKRDLIRHFRNLRDQ